MALLFPIVVFFAHGIDVVGDEVDGLAEGIRALAEYLDGLFHKLDVLIGETAALGSGWLVRGLVWVGGSDATFGCRFLVRCLGSSTWPIDILLSDFVHLYGRSLIRDLLRRILLVLLQQCLSLPNQRTLLLIHRIDILLHHGTAMVILLLLRFLALPNEPLVLLLRLHHHLLLLLHALLLKHVFLLHLHLTPHHLLLLLPLLLDAQLIVYLSLLLLSLLFGPLLLLLSSLHFRSLLHLSCLLRLSLSLLLSSSDLLGRGSVIGRLLLGRCAGCRLFRGVALPHLAKDFGNVGLGVDAGSGCSEHLLEPEVGLVGLLASQDHAGLDVDLLLDYHFG